MDFNCGKATSCLKKFCGFCCTFKRDLLNNNNYEKTIEILPRIIVCKKFKVCETYCQPLTVRNTGALTRRIKFIAEPSSDITFKISGNTELTSGASVSVDIYVEPTKSNSINRDRFFYVVAEHPDIVWEIPIIVIGKCSEVFVPQLICLYKVPANTNSNYQFVIYNPLETEISFSISSKYEGLTVTPLTSTVAAKDYCKILINGKMSSEILTTALNVSVKNGKCFIIRVYMEPSDQVIHLSTSVLNFEDTYMGSRVQKHFHICNKSMDNVGYRWQCSESVDVEQKMDGKADEELQISEFLSIKNKPGLIPPNNSTYSTITAISANYGREKIAINIDKHSKAAENVAIHWTCCNDDEDEKVDGKVNEELKILNFLTIKNKRGCIPPMNSALSIVTFSPPIEFNYNEEEEPPFKINVPLYLRCPIIGSQLYHFHVNASILGPEIEITPKDIDVGNIFMGQMQCMKLEVFNKGPINGKISYKDHTDQHEIRCLITPTSIDLKINCRGIFHLKYYRRDVGKFLTKLTFKIKSGNIVPILLRGTSLPAKVKTWPEFFEYGAIPICIPQKRFAMVVNPLPVPIVVEPIVVDDGAEDPLILCVDYSKLPLNARPATYYNLKCRKSDFRVNVVEEDLKPDYSDFQLESKSSASTQASTTASVNFQNKVIENIPVMAEGLLYNVKNQDAQFQSEPGMKIIDAALDCILDQSDYFDDLKYKQNYLHMDWEALPTDAKEIGIEVERFYLQPNESKSFPVVLVPNSPGPATKTIDFKACPLGAEHVDLKAAVRSKYMINSLRLEYICTLPALEYNEYIKFCEPMYVDMVHNFHMNFKNIDLVPGFIYYKVIPQSPLGKMMVNTSSQKFFLAPNHMISAECSVIFYTVGTVTLCGMIRIIGKLVQQPFTIEADVIPPKIRITPEKSTINQQVLDFTRARIFIENVCPTVAKFSLSLKNEKYQFLEPMGGSLAPGQIILISVYSKFYDPGMFKNIIYVNLKHAEKIIIPLTFIVEGTPILFEPNIKLGLDCGNLFRNKGFRDNFITITNYGERTYRLLLLKKKSKANTLIPITVFEVQPSGITISPKDVLVINIRLDTSREASVEEEFSVDGMGEDSTRFKFFTFIAKCVIIKAKVSWSIPEVCLEAGNADERKDKMQETVHLINTTALVLNVTLNLHGNFILRNDATGSTENTVSLCLMGKQSKQFTVSFNEDEIDPIEACQCYKGSIQVKINNKPQTYRRDTQVTVWLQADFISIKFSKGELAKIDVRRIHHFIKSVLSRLGNSASDFVIADSVLSQKTSSDLSVKLTHIKLTYSSKCLETI